MPATGFAALPAPAVGWPDLPQAPLRDQAKAGWRERSGGDLVPLDPPQRREDPSATRGGLEPAAEIAREVGLTPELGHLQPLGDRLDHRVAAIVVGMSGPPASQLYPTFAGQDTLRPDIRLLRPIPRLPDRTIAAAALPAPGRAPAVTAFIQVMRTVAGRGSDA
jgi:hypothetical protein